MNSPVRLTEVCLHGDEPVQLSAKTTAGLAYEWHCHWAMTSTSRPGPVRILELRSVRGTGGGPEKTILLGASRSDRSRYDVTVCYVRDARDTVFGIDARAAQLGIEYVELTERHSFDPRLWSALRALVREGRFDIVHSHDYKTDLLALLLARAEGTIPLTTAHGWTGHSRRERWLYYPAGKRLIRAFPMAIAVSGEIRSELIRAGAHPDRVRVVLNGIDHNAFRRDRSQRDSARQALGLQRHDVVIGAIGRAEPQKRFDLLIEACAALRQRWPALRLVIAGDGSQLRALESLAAPLFSPGVCRLLGHDSDIIRLHHAIDLFVQSSDYEGTPNAVLEAMALESPVVATAAGGTAEIVADGVHGIVVPTGDATVLAAAIERALSDRAGCRERAQRARRRVETELSFDARMNQVERIYSELVNDRAHRSPAETARRCA